MEKVIYRPVGALPHISKFFEKIMYTQMERFKEDKLLKLLPGFRNNHGTQCCLINIQEKCKNTLDKGGFVCGMLMDYQTHLTQ